MKLKLDNPKIFSEVISIISELVLEVKMKVSSEGLRIVAIDPANVAMVSFQMPAEVFAELEVEKEEVLGVSLESLKAVLRRCSPRSILLMRTNESQITLEIIDKVKREFNLALIEVEGQEKEVPNLEFVSKIEMSGADLSSGIEDCAIVADSCGFVSEPDKFTIQAKGALNSFKSEFSSDELNIQAQESRSKYSLEYLQKIIGQIN
jgi:proliferating cell nuclear antigen